MAALETFVATPPPLVRDSDNVVRVAGTRVRLETVLTAFQQGNTPETIADKYPVLHLADIYAVITYYLQHRPDIDGYLAQRRRQIAEAEREIATRFPQEGVRERLLARRTERL